MAITKTYINGDNVVLHDFLQTLVPDFFASVVYTDPEDTTTAILCKDASGNTLMSFKSDLSGSNPATTIIGYFTATASITSSYSGSTSAGPGGKIKYAYRTAKGALFVLNGDDYAGHVIAKTSNGTVGFALQSANSGYTTTYKTGAWGNEIANRNVAMSVLYSSSSYSSATVGFEQTTLCPIPTHPMQGETEYLDGAFFTLWKQYDVWDGILDIDGKKYVVNGAIALLDE